MNRLTAQRCNGIKTGYWSAAKKEELIQRLAAYENTGLMPEQIEALKKIADANEAGRLIELPCKIGDTIYMIITKRPKINFPEFSFIKTTRMTQTNCFRVSQDYGKTVFLTRKEAEAALERMKNE